MNQQIEGKSIYFNTLAIVLNLVGLLLLVLGYHESNQEESFNYLIIGYPLFIIGLSGVFILKGNLLFSYISRVLVGGLFIVSGLIKANDTKGFSYKLEEYFEDGALAYRIKELFGWDSFSLEFLIQHALALSIIICVLEIVLGVMTILGVKIKLATWTMLAMMIFFTLLTWHTSMCKNQDTFRDVDTYSVDSPIGQLKVKDASWNNDISVLSHTESTITIAEIKKVQCVEDCGCFGDAMKGSIGRSLTPNESFWKDLVLLYFVLIILIANSKIKKNTIKENAVMITFGSVFILFFSWLFGWYFPLLFGLITIFASLWVKQAGGKILGNDWGIILVTTITSSLFTTYTLSYLPLKDYRPYHVGSVLEEKMNDGEDGIFTSEFIYTNTLTNKDTTLTALDASTEEIWKNPDIWAYKDRIQKTIKPTKLPSITDQFHPKILLDEATEVELNQPFVQQQLSENQVPFVELIDKSNGERYPQELESFFIEDVDTSAYIIGDTIYQVSSDFSEVSFLDYILTSERIILVISQQMENGNFSNLNELKSIQEGASQNNIPILMISTSSKADVEAFRNKYGLILPTLVNDETEIKAITRSNPTLMVVENGIITAKYPYRSTPNWDWLDKNLFNK